MAWLQVGIKCAVGSSMVGLLQQIVDILQTSTIAEERGKDIRSKFWAAYKKVSGEYDNDMLERCNGNMDIVLIFVCDISLSLNTHPCKHKVPGRSVLRR